jgi:Arc/MetJ-type ribon-helix-helix transcriptional regulator
MNKNVTFSLPATLMENVRELVEEGYKSSINNLVREALESYLAGVKKNRIREAMLRAIQDPLFLADVNECENDFRHTDKECNIEW